MNLFEYPESVIKSVDPILYDDQGFILDTVDKAFDWLVVDMDIDPMDYEGYADARAQARIIAEKARKLRGRLEEMS